MAQVKEADRCSVLHYTVRVPQGNVGPLKHDSQDRGCRSACDLTSQKSIRWLEFAVHTIHLSSRVGMSTL